MHIGKEDKQFVDSILDEQEQTWIREFVRNHVLFEAVRKILLIPVYHSGVLKKGEKPDMTRNFMLSITNRREQTNEELGKQARAVAEAVALLDAGFSYLEMYKHDNKENINDKTNP